MKKLLSIFIFCCLATLCGQTVKTMDDPYFLSDPPPEGDTCNFTNGMKVVQTFSRLLGPPAVWTTHLTNSSHSAQTYLFAMGGDVVAYNGQSIRNIGSMIATNSLSAGEWTNIVFTVSCDQYLPWESHSFTFQYGARVESGGETWGILRRAGLDVVGEILTLQPATPTLRIGQTVTATIHFINPLPIPLQNVEVEIAGKWGFAKNGENAVEKWQLGTIQPNAIIHAEKTFAAQKLANASIIGFIRSDELNVLRHDMQIDIVE